MLCADTDAVLACFDDARGSAKAPGRAFFGLGEPQAAARLVEAALTGCVAYEHHVPGAVGLSDGAGAFVAGGMLEAAGAPVAGTLPAEAWQHVAPTLVAHLVQRSPWDWMETTRVPPVMAGEERVVELDPAMDAGAIRALHEVAMPGSIVGAESPGFRWFGVRGAGDELLGVAAGSGWESSVHLGGIAVHPAHRGRGIGAAVTARITRLGIEATGAVSLGLWSDNHGARRLYERLGYRITRRLESRRMD